MTAEFEREIDRLYGLPRDEFVPRRNELATRLRKAGQREQADAVRGLEKPTVAAWAVNRLQRAEKPTVRRLLRAGEKIREAQAGALAGSSSGRLRSAATEQHDAVQALAAKARDLLADEVSEATLDRIGWILRAASVDPEARRLLERGRLTREPEPAGFGALEGLPVKRSPARERTKRGAKTPRDRKAREARERIAALKKEIAEHEREARSARRVAEAAERKAEQARSRLRKLEAE